MKNKAVFVVAELRAREPRKLQQFEDPFFGQHNRIKIVVKNRRRVVKYLNKYINKYTII